MKAQTSSTSDKIARAVAALKSGLLANYAPAKSMNGTNTKTLSSWGPAMRT